MKKNLMIGLTAIAGLTVLLGATEIKPQPENTSDEVKTVAWYVANIPQARQQNKLCFDNPELKETPNCQNSLHALQISFQGNN